MVSPPGGWQEKLARDGEHLFVAQSQLKMTEKDLVAARRELGESREAVIKVKGDKDTLYIGGWQ